MLNQGTIKSQSWRPRIQNWKERLGGYVRNSGSVMRTVSLAREWFLVLLTGIIFLIVIIRPAGFELYPVMDWKGGDQFNMPTDKDVYHCGDIPQARFTYQKNRSITGKIKWMLIPSTPEGHIDHFPARVAASPIGIYDKWVNIEKLPIKCEPGKYHFEGSITYPLFIGTVTYDIRTQCFKIEVP